MKSFSLIALCFATFIVLRPLDVCAAALKSAPDSRQTEVSSVDRNISKKVRKQESRLMRMKKKLAKKIEKWKARFTGPLTGNYLYLSLGLLAAAILFLALSGPTGIFNVIGAIAFIAAVSFFVLWLLKFRKGYVKPEE